MPTYEQFFTFVGGGIAAMLATILTYRRGTKQDSAGALQQRRELELQEFSAIVEAQRAHMSVLDAQITILSARMESQAATLKDAIQAVQECEMKHVAAELDNRALRERVSWLESKLGDQ